MSVTNWSPRPGGNAVADPAIPAQDSCSAREFPALVRGVMAGVAALALDHGGALVSTGTDNEYVVSTNSGVAAPKPGVSVAFWADRDNSGTPFINIDGSGPRQWLGADGLPQPAGTVQAGLLYTVAWTEALPGSVPSWRTVGASGGAGAGTGLTGFDFSGTLAERATYDAQPKGKVYLAVAEAPTGPAWTLYVKRSNGFADWSAGLPIKASPAQSTVEALAALQQATTQAQIAADKAVVATTGASTATTQAGIATTRATTATTAATTATTQAGLSDSARVAAQAAADVATAAQPGMVFDYPTKAAAQAATVPASKLFFRTAGLSAAGDGYSAVYVQTSAPTVGPGGIVTANGLRFEVDPSSLRLELFGTAAGNPAANLAAVQAAAQFTKVARLDTSITVAPTADLNSYFGTTYQGRGKLDGLYRKYVAGDLAPSALTHFAGDLSPLEHCPTSCRTRAAIEVLIGDSISSYSANNNTRSTMISTVLERALRSQARASGRTVTFYNRALGGQSWATLADKPSTSMDRVIAWYPDRTRRWLDVVKDLAPTRVFISFGMNDLAGISATAMQAVVNEIRSWRFGTGADAYTTDIVVLTNLVPRPYVGPLLPSNGPWNTQATQEGADRAAGFIRTFARRYGLGLLDMHRMCCRARDGFDPTEGTFAQVRDSVVTGAGATGTRAVYGFSGHFRIDPTKFAANGSSSISIKHGPGDADLFILTKTTVADQYQIVVLSGDAGNQIGVSGPTLVTIPPPSDQAFELVFEKTGNLGFLYLAGLTFSGNYGESTPNIWSGDLVSRGGLFTPSITSNATGSIFGIGFDYMTPTICRPITDATTLFGTGDGTFPPEAGSGYNHPSVYVEPYIYAIVLGAARLYDGDPCRMPVGKAVRWDNDAGSTIGYLTTDTTGTLAFTDAAGKVSNVVGGAWTTYTPTYTATNGGTVTFTPQRTSYEVVGKTLRIQGQFQVTSTSAIAFLDVSLPPGVSLKHGCSGVAANLGTGAASSATGLGGQTALRINGSSPFFGTTGGIIAFNATVEIA